MTSPVMCGKKSCETPLKKKQNFLFIVTILIGMVFSQYQTQ